MSLTTSFSSIPKHPKKVYKVVKALYGLHQAPRAWYATLSTFLLKNGYRRGTIDKTLFLKKDNNDIILVQVYVDDIIFGSTKISWKEDVKDEEASDVDVHLYRSMIGSLMYLTASRPDIMFANSYSDSDYVDANLDRKSPQQEVVNSWRRLISWQCKKQTIMATSTTEAEYVAAASCCLLNLFKPISIAQFRTHSLSKLHSHFQALISTFTTISISSKMAVLDSCPKHNMVAYLEKSEGNKEFHDIIDFLKRSSIHFVLTVSPTISTTFVEQFWTSAKSKTINDVRHITAKVAGKSVSISEASIRSDLHFDDADRIDTLPNQAIFNAIQQMGPSPTNTIPASIPESFGENLGGYLSSDKSLSGIGQGNPSLNGSDHKAKIAANLVHKEYVSKQGRKFAKGESSVQRDPLFDEMPEDKIDHMETENAQSEGRTREMGNEDKDIDERMLSTEDVISTDKEGVSTDFEKVSTDRPIVSTDGSKVSTDRQIEGTEDQVEGDEDQVKGTEDKNEGTEEIFEGTEELREGTEEKVESTDGQVKGTEDQTEEEIATQTSTQTPTSMIFGDDETIAKVLLNKAVSKEKEKGVELKDVEEVIGPKAYFTKITSQVTPLPKIEPKDTRKNED
ncbi:putative ribonuclease H-like domain-containing protein [Tanacetum coccineum]